jgi:hypothetical protein
MTKNLDEGKTLLGIGKLRYGFDRGCVNYTARSLLYVGVPTFSAISLISAPLLLNGELIIRQLGISASHTLIR